MATHQGTPTPPEHAFVYVSRAGLAYLRSPAGDLAALLIRTRPDGTATIRHLQRDASPKDGEAHATVEQCMALNPAMVFVAG